MTAMKIMWDLIFQARCLSSNPHINKQKGPGELIESLSSEKREILQTLKPEDLDMPVERYLLSGGRLCEICKGDGAVCKKVGEQQCPYSPRYNPSRQRAMCYSFKDANLKGNSND